MKRVYDNPSHPAYGPVRRMWVVLAQLDLLGSAEGLRYKWDDALASRIMYGVPEARAQRFLLKHIMENVT